MNDWLNKYKIILKEIDSGFPLDRIKGDCSNNVIKAIAGPDYEQMKSNFTKMSNYLLKRYDANPGKNEIYDILCRLSLPNWPGAWAELSALYCINSYDDFLPDPLQINHNINSNQTFGQFCGKTITNCDLKIPDTDITFDVKILGDRIKSVLESVVSAALKKANSKDEVQFVFNADDDPDIYESKVRDLIVELENALKGNSERLSSSIAPSLKYNIIKKPGVYMNHSEYDPYKHAQEAHLLVFKHFYKLQLHNPSLLLYLDFPWFSVSNPLSHDIFYRSFCRRLFCQYVNSVEPAGNYIKNYNGSDSIGDATKLLSGILIIKDDSLSKAGDEQFNVQLYLNPNAKNPMPDYGGIQIFKHRNVLIDRFEHDNY